MGNGESVAFAIFQLQDRGIFFIGANAPLYEGLIVGENSKDKDLMVNMSKSKNLTNVRSSGNDVAIKLTPPRDMTLEESLEYIGTDELVEVTPDKYRIRKMHLKEIDRKRAAREA